MRDGKLSKWKKIGICTAVFLFLLYLNRSVRYCTDDWHFQFVFQGFWPQDGLVKVETFSDVWQSALNYYRMSGGRILAHAVTFCMLMPEQWLFDVINSGMFVLLGILICLLTPDKGWRRRSWSLALVYFAVIFFSFSFGDSAVWLSGSVNYLWTGVLNLLAILYFQRCTEKHSGEKKCLPGIGLLMFLAGQSNEITGGMLLVLLFFWCLKDLQAAKKNLPAYGAAALSALCGMGIVLLAPGNRNRTAVVHGGPYDFTSVRDCVLTYMTELLNKTWILLILSLFVLFLQIRKENWRKVLASHAFLWAGTLGTAALGLSGTVIRRGSFIPVILLIIEGCDSLEYLLRKAPEEYRRYRAQDASQQKLFASLVLRLVGALAITEVLYALTVLLQSNAAFESRDSLFLFRGIGLMALSLAFLCLPQRKRWTEKKLRFGRRAVVFFISIFAGLYLFQNILPFRANSLLQRQMEEGVRRAAEAREGEIVLVPGPLYLPSVFWPEEGSCSVAYTQAWMRAYFEWKGKERTNGPGGSGNDWEEGSTVWETE